MDRMPIVFVAAVYETSPHEFARGLLRAGESLRLITNIVPVLPHLRLIDVDPGERMEWERDLIGVADAVVVIGGREHRADLGHEGVEQWTDFATTIGCPVFDGPAPLVDWVAGR